MSTGDVSTVEAGPRTTLSEKAWAKAESILPADMKSLIESSRKASKETGTPFFEALGVMALAKGMSSTEAGTGDQILDSVTQFAKDALNLAYPNKVGTKTAIGGILGGAVLCGAHLAIKHEAPSLLTGAFYFAAAAAASNHMETA